MSRSNAFSILLTALASACTGPVLAGDYPPVTCDARAAYAGRPLRAAVDIDVPTPAIPDSPLDPGTARRLDDAFTLTQGAARAPTMTAAVAIPGKGEWQRNAAPAGTPPVWFWASVGKTMTAVVVLQLAEEGKLSLDDKVSRWIRDVPNGDVATVRDLLAHTSGLFSANEDLPARADPRYRPPSETLTIARRHGAMFCPGANWRYSNTGYDLLGEIIARLDGRPFEQSIAARIIQPLALRSMRALVPGSDADGVAPLQSARERPIDPSWTGAAGAIVADAADMARFWAALMEGRLVPRKTVEAMFGTLYPMFDPGTFYGLGVMAFDVPDKDRQLLWLGHAGGTPGASAVLAYSPADNAIVAVALTGDGPAVAVANQLLKAVRAAP
ncbi:serine hydrolase [Variovorax sp. OV329]|uniref:serine hydrolase domain-containing protein n=1 Tax=Variovorax sp. OV329 TaxID=1882825 RepID=UPI0008E45EFA|nr:serine hydrolase domain-containing protein [Variovorax sp. OV329]SFM14592.1 D-alanyl-D-alanine carboxypeptidase [Variovorax sp. OV329]